MDKKSFFSKLKWLDPFTYVDVFVMPHVKKITKNKWVEHLVNVFFALLFAILIYSLLGFLFGTSAPLVIVYSESMEPSFYRGDIIGLTRVSDQTNFGREVFVNKKISNLPVNTFAQPHYSNGLLEKIFFENNQEIIVNDFSNNAVIVFTAFPNKIPIIHRSIVKIVASDGNFVLTKGDNYTTNPTFDQDCGVIDQIRTSSQKNCVTFYAIPVEKIEGVKFFQIPLVGCVKLWIFDNFFSIITTGKLPKDFKGFC